MQANPKQLQKDFQKQPAIFMRGSTAMTCLRPDRLHTWRNNLKQRMRSRFAAGSPFLILKIQESISRLIQRTNRFSALFPEIHIISPELFFIKMQFPKWDFRI